MNTTEGEKMEALSFSVLFESVRTTLSLHYPSGLVDHEAGPVYGPEWDSLRRVFNDWQAVVAYSPHQSVAASVGTISRLAYWQAAIERDGVWAFLGVLEHALPDAAWSELVRASFYTAIAKHEDERQALVTAFAVFEAVLKGAAACIVQRRIVRVRL